MINPSRHLRLSGVLVTVVDSGDRDEMNRPIPTESRKPVRFWWHPAGVSETTNQADRQTERRTAYFSNATVIRSNCRLEHGGQGWEFDGPAEAWIHPHTGHTVGQTATLVRVS